MTAATVPRRDRGPCQNARMRLYLAGPMFTDAERAFLEQLADRLTASGHDCFVPHLQRFEPVDAPTVFAVDSAGLRDADAVVAWLDGPGVDDGTACEIGIFAELVRTAPDRHRGIVGLVTDLRVLRRRDRGMADGGINLFVGGAIAAYGQLAWGVDEVEEILAQWSRPVPPSSVSG